MGKILRRLIGLYLVIGFVYGAIEVTKALMQDVAVSTGSLILKFVLALFIWPVILIINTLL